MSAGNPAGKRALLLACCCLLLVFCTACRKTQAPAMFIEPAQLTDKEKDIADLLGLGKASILYDFTLDDTVRSMQINVYELIGGEWSLMAGGGGQAFTDTQGRIALGFESLAQGMRIAVQSEHSGGSTTNEREDDSGAAPMGMATATLAEKKEITYAQEIPLAVQIHTAQNEVHSYTPDSFFTPEEYEKHGYEHVYALTISFSQAARGA